MIKSFEIKDVFYIGIITIVCLFLFEQCNQNNRNKKLVNHNAKVHEMELKSYIDKYNREVTLRENLVYSNSKELKKVLSQNDRMAESLKKYKNLKNVTQIKTVTKIVIDSIPIYDTIFIESFDSIKFDYKTNDYSLIATLKKTNLSIDSILIPNEQTLVVGGYKPSLFKKSSLTASVSNSNPLIKTTFLKNHVVEVPKKWYEKPFITIPLGLAAGLLIK